MFCSVLRCVGVCCSVLHCVVRRLPLPETSDTRRCVAVYRSVLQRFAVYRSVSHWVAVGCSGLQCVAGRCTAAVYCRALQNVELPGTHDTRRSTGSSSGAKKLNSTGKKSPKSQLSGHFTCKFGSELTFENLTGALHQPLPESTQCRRRLLKTCAIKLAGKT